MSVLSMPSRKVALVAVAAALGGAGVGVALAQVGTASATSPQPTASAPPAPEWHHGDGWHGFPGPALGALGGRLLHGEATVRLRSGGTEVVTEQTGTVTSIAGSTFTVTSTDHYVGTYQVGSQTRILVNGATVALGKLKSGTQVMVLGVRHGAAVDARAVLSGMPAMGGMPHPPGMRGWMPGPLPSGAPPAGA